MGTSLRILTQLFEVLEHAGFAWFSIDYRNLEDVRAAVRYIECPGRFNIGSRLVLIAEDAGAAPAVRVAAEAKANGVVLFGARFDAHPPAPGTPLLIFHGTNDEEVPPREIEGSSPGSTSTDRNLQDLSAAVKYIAVPMERFKILTAACDSLPECG